MITTVGEYFWSLCLSAELCIASPNLPAAGRNGRNNDYTGGFDADGYDNMFNFWERTQNEETDRMVFS